jgi:endonuclease-3
MAPGKNVLEVEKKFLKVTPDAWIMHAHHWLILHGRHVCKARKPDCANCCVYDLCRYKAKTV